VLGEVEAVGGGLGLADDVGGEGREVEVGGVGAGELEAVEKRGRAFGLEPRAR